jgi:hypothetical protein
MNSFAHTAIIAYSRYFIQTENKLSLISSERKYKKLATILEIFSNIAHNTNFTNRELEFFYDAIIDYQKEYINKLKLFGFKIDDSRYNKIIHVDNLGERIKSLDSFISSIDGSKFDILNNMEDSRLVRCNTDNNLFANLYIEYFKAYMCYTNIVKDFEYNRVGKESYILHTGNAFINEFHQCMTHYSYTFYANKYGNKYNKKYNSYINDNFNRAIRHLERAILDIYKVSISMLIKNSIPITSEYKNIIKVRTFEINRLGVPIHNKIDEYKKLLDNILERYRDKNN